MESSFTSESGLAFLLETAAHYQRPGFFLFIAGAALAVTAVLGRREGRVFFFYPFLICLFTVFNPFVFPSFIRESAFRPEEFYHLFWLIPCPVITGFGTIVAAYRQKKGIRRNTVYVFVAVLLLAVSVPSVRSLSEFRLPSDLYLTDEQVEMVCNYITDRSGMEDPVVAFEDVSFRTAAREYSEGLAISRLFDHMGDITSVRRLEGLLEKYGPDLIVLRKEGELSALARELKLKTAAYTEDYIVFFNS